MPELPAWDRDHKFDDEEDEPCLYVSRVHHLGAICEFLV